MKTQNKVKITLSEPQAIEKIKDILNSGIKNRTELAERTCHEFGLVNQQGVKQLSGCLKALRKLENEGKIELPKSRNTRGKVVLQPSEKGVPEPEGVPGEAGKIKGLALMLVTTREQKRIWNDVMITDHPRGAGLFVGCQLFYLVASEYGWLGGFGFSSAALHLEDRDKWIGWDWQERQDRLHYVVNMNRFLIRSSVCCKNLASRLLGMVVKALPNDFEARYGYRPLLLESFVDTEHVNGTCYRAANWQFIGRSKGLSVQEFPKERSESIKEIYVYPLEKDFRAELGLPKNSGAEAIDIASGLDDDHWAKNEFGNAPLGDKRLSNRLIEIANNKGGDPGRSYCGAAEGDWPKVKAYYRFIDSPDNSAVTMEHILLPHRERTIRRMKAQHTVLCIQDGTDLNYSNLDKCSGLGVIGSNQTSARSKGLHLHSTLAITPHGLPLGVLRAECNTPVSRNKNDKRKYVDIPVEEKKNYAWIASVMDGADLKRLMPHTKLVNISDREADFFEMFDHHRVHRPNVDLLIRAKYDRQTTEGKKLFETVRQSPVQAHKTISVPRQSARSKKSRQKARPKQHQRIADVSIRYKKVELKPPQDYKGGDAIPMWIIHVSEENPPPDAKPIEWFLLTTIDLTTADDALTCIHWYCLRWRIEDWHRVLKSGCKVETLAHETVERLKRAIAINLVIAWRIMLMTLLGREMPNLPPDMMFSDLEIEVLGAYGKKKAFNPQVWRQQ